MKGHPHRMQENGARGIYRRRQDVRRIARELVDELTNHWPGTSVTIDLDGVDEEDAFLWISPVDPESRDQVALTALELVNRHGARMGLWIVPRVLNHDGNKDDISHRLRQVHSEEQPIG